MKTWCRLLKTGSAKETFLVSFRLSSKLKLLRLISDSEDLYKKFADANMLIPNLSAPLPVKWLKRLGRNELPGALKVEDFDYMHTLIYADEMARGGSMGPSGAVTTGVAFGLPPILKFGSQALQERFVPNIITGKKRVCIAITEPGAGSDVANIATTAKRTPDGKHFIINGTKKWCVSVFRSMGKVFITHIFCNTMLSTVVSKRHKGYLSNIRLKLTPCKTGLQMVYGLTMRLWLSGLVGLELQAFLCLLYRC